MLEYAFLALGYPLSPLTPEEVSLLFSYAVSITNGDPLSPDLEAFGDLVENYSTRFAAYKATQKNFNLTQYLLKNSLR